MRSLLSDEGLPLTPAAYLLAVLSSIRDVDVGDRQAVSALSSFLSVLLPLVPVASLSPSKLKDAMTSTVIPILRLTSPVGPLPAPTVRSLVSALGFLILGLDGDDWSSAEVAVEMLLKFAVDRRPKVRKCAQSYVEKSFLYFKGTALGKNYRKLIISMFKECASLSISNKLENSNVPKSEHVEMLHMLQVMKLITPNMLKKTVVKLLPTIYDILPFTVFSHHVFPALEVLMERIRLDDLVSESQKIICSLSTYVSLNRQISGDIVISVSSLFRNILHRIYPIKPRICVGSLPAIFDSLTDYLSSENDAAQHVLKTLKELINCYIDQNIFRIDADMLLDSGSSCSTEVKAVQSLCSLLEKNICACCGIPNRHILAVVSDLFAKLGGFSVQIMKNIILELAQRTMGAPDFSDLKHLQECIGSAIMAIGPEKMFDLFPILLNEETMICSNTWLIPLLRKYVCRSSLLFFMEKFVPLVKHLKKYRKGENSFARKDSQHCMHELWDLLPAFCHYPIDTYQNFGSLAEILAELLVEDIAFQKPIAVALQVLLNENKWALKEEKDGENDDMLSVVTIDLDNFGLRSMGCCYSKEDATNNMKAVVSRSIDLFEALIRAYCNSSQENRLHLKGAIECLTPIVGSSFLQKSFNSLLEGFELKGSKSESDFLSNDAHLSNGVKRKRNVEKDERRNTVLELACCFVVGARDDLVVDIYNYIKPFILDGVGHSNQGAYLVLCRILKEHNWFCAENVDHLLNHLIGKKPSDANLLRIYLSCLHFLLIYLVKNDKEEKAFLILNEIILTIKDSDKEVREAAYDLLFGISTALKNSMSCFSESPRDKLLTMIMGYLSGTSSQITSGAVAAISLLVYKDPDICVSVPRLLPSIIALLRKKDVDVIKASLGFIKVLISSLVVTELNAFVPDIVTGILPWSSITKNHFRTKVKIIFDIMSRRCGAAVVNATVPEKYKRFVRNIQDNRKKKHSSKKGASVDAKKVHQKMKSSLKKAGNVDAEKVPGDSPMKRDRKRKLKDISFSGDKGSGPSVTQEQKKHKFISSGVERHKDQIREPSRSTYSRGRVGHNASSNSRMTQKGRADGRKSKGAFRDKQKQQ